MAASGSDLVSPAAGRIDLSAARRLGVDPGDPWLGSDPPDPGFRDDPEPALRRLREIDPVNQTPIGVWRLSRYDDCVRLLTEVPTRRPLCRRHVPAIGTPPPAAVAAPASSCSSRTRRRTRGLRKLVSQAFTPRAVSGCASASSAASTSLLDAALGARRDGRHRRSRPAGAVDAHLRDDGRAGRRSRRASPSGRRGDPPARRGIAPPEVIAARRSPPAGSAGAYFQELIEDAPRAT